MAYTTSETATGLKTSVATTAGGQVLAAANKARKRLVIYNDDTANAIYIHVGTPTTSTMKIKAGASMSVYTKAAVSAIAETAAVNVYTWEETN